MNNKRGKKKSLFSGTIFALSDALGLIFCVPLWDPIILYTRCLGIRKKKFAWTRSCCWSLVYKKKKKKKKKKPKSSSKPSFTRTYKRKSVLVLSLGSSKAALYEKRKIEISEFGLFTLQKLFSHCCPSSVPLFLREFFWLWKTSRSPHSLREEKSFAASIVSTYQLLQQ